MPSKGDATRSSRNVGAGCDGRCGVRQLAAGRNARSVRRSRVVLAPRPWRLFCGRYPAENGDNKRRSPGRARISRQTIAWGKPGCLGCTCLIRVRFLFSLHTVLRAQSAPGFPCALCQREGHRNCKNPGENKPRERARLSPRHCERSEAIQFPEPRQESWIDSSLRSSQ